MPAAPSSLTDPAIGQLLTAARALDGDRAELLPVLAVRAVGPGRVPVAPPLSWDIGSDIRGAS
jgi:hypothetical protein